VNILANRWYNDDEYGDVNDSESTFIKAYRGNGRKLNVSPANSSDNDFSEVVWIPKDRPELDKDCYSTHSNVSKVNNDKIFSNTYTNSSSDIKETEMNNQVKISVEKRSEYLMEVNRHGTISKRMLLNSDLILLNNLNHVLSNENYLYTAKAR